LPRPDVVALVVGTGTEVGKTWFAVELLKELADGVTISARKPAQSFERRDRETDADRLAAVTGEPANRVCSPHRWYECAMAPPMAADVLGRPPFRVADLVGELEWSGAIQFGLIEAAGGVASPLAADGDSSTLADQIEPDLVVLVADAGLGTINAVRLSVAALEGHQPVVFLNRFESGDDLHARNRDWLAQIDGFDVEVSVGAMVRRCVDRCRQVGDQGSGDQGSER
jgi:dethiobiotin synthetase